MKPVFFPDQTALIDNFASQSLDLPKDLLMENAALSSCLAILVTLQKIGVVPNLSNKWEFFIFCGPGNNGGDGCALARHFWTRGLTVRLFIDLKRADKRGSDLLKIQLGRLKKLGVPPEPLEKGISGLNEVKNNGGRILIDALFGTGFRGALASEYLKVVDGFNRSGSKIFSLDIPSGIDGKTGLGQKEGFIQADWTLAFHSYKTGHFFNQGLEACGEIQVLPISIPLSNPKGTGNESPMENFRFELIEEGDIPPHFPHFPLNSYKKTSGVVALWAGSKKFPGAGLMAGLSTVASGAGLVYAFQEPDYCPAWPPEVIPLELEEFYSALDSDKILHLLEKLGVGVFLIGPGVDFKKKGALALLKTLILKWPGILILDAAPFGRGELENWLIQRKKQKWPETLLTPHSGEFKAFFKTSPEEVLFEDPMGKPFEKTLEDLGVSLLLKGPQSVIFSGGRRFMLEKTANPFWARGGSGDILAGLIAGTRLRFKRDENARALIYSLYVQKKVGEVLQREGGGLLEIMKQISKWIWGGRFPG